MRLASLWCVRRRSFAAVVAVLGAAVVANAQPTVTGISPAVTASANAQTYTISGSGFLAGLSVTFVSPTGPQVTYSAPNVMNVTATSFQVVATIGSSGSWGVKVTNPAVTSGTFTFSAAAPVVASLPTISSITPPASTTNPIPTALTITGTNFRAGAAVVLTDPLGRVNSGTAVTVLQPGTQLRIVPVLYTQGPWMVSITNPDSGKSNRVGLQVSQYLAPAPQVTSISPATPTASTTAQVLAIAGNAFVAPVTVRLTNPAGTVSSVPSGQVLVQSLTSIRATVALGTTGTWKVQVINPDGGTSQYQFSVTGPARVSAPTSLAAPTVRVGSSGSVVLAVSNTGSASTGALQAVILGTNTSEFQVSPRPACLGAALVGGATCNLPILFTPAAAGSRSATITLTLDSSQVTVVITGTASP